MSSETAIQSTPTPDVLAAEITPPPVKRNVTARYLIQAVNVASSLKVTVALFLLSIFLVFCGTLAQVGNGNWTVVDDYFRSAFVWVPFQIFFKRSFLTVPGTFPYPGGWLLGGLLLINLLAAHVGLIIKLIRTRASSQQFQTLMLKRSGILILHFGVVVIMVGELITGKYAAEGVMTIPDAKASNYRESTRKAELAVVDPSDPNVDDVVVIPDKRLRRGGLIQDAALPFDVEVRQYMVNSALVKAEQANRATAGGGLQWVAVEKPEVSGADSEQPEDLPSAYVTFKKKASGQELGTFLVSRWFGLADQPVQKVTVDGKSYDIELRRQRTYTPYTIYLKKFTHDKYPGTDIPKDFASEVRLVDPGAGEEIEAKIWMNHPLRYNGETFYQQGFLPGDTGTIIQVVRNPGWLLPYLSCFLVALGMIVHFGIKLVQFLEQQMVKARPVTPFGKWAPRLGVVLLGGLILFSVAVPQAEGTGQMGLDDFGRLPVLDGGRIKPIDTLARNYLMVISSRQTIRDEKQKSQPATKWLLDVLTSNPEIPELKPGVDIFQNPAAVKAKVFRIENDQVLSLLGLQPRDGLRYSIAEFGGQEKIAKLARRAHQAEETAEATEFDANVLEFAKHLRLYFNLESRRSFKIIPPTSSNQKEWLSLPEAIINGRRTGVTDPAVVAMLTLFLAYDKNDASAFNQALADYKREVSDRLPSDANTAGFEAFFNRFEPFYLCTLMYGLVGVLACVSFLLLCFRERGWAEPMRRTAFWLLVLTLVVHTFGLVARMYIQDRWFVMVTNLYSSAVFIGWGCVVLGLIIELMFRMGIGSLVASVLGLGTTIVAHNLAAGGDTMEMMRAVLDTNFWLATHVTCVTLGYTATFVAGFLALAFIGIGVGTKLMDSDLMKVLSWMIYGVICFATLLSFVGTVLGGIWADQSWGRFWGWDPKENGALMIVIWNVLILHARWAGLVKQRGTAVLAVGGNIITAWSWFGVNMLGVGLHSYGFMNGAVFWLWTFVLFNLGVMGVGMLPMHMWLSSTTMRNRGFLADA